MFGRKYKEENKILKEKLQKAESYFFAAGQDYEQVNKAVLKQIAQFTNHPAAMKNYMHKICDAIEECIDEDKISSMYNAMSSVINQRYANS